MIKSFFLLLVSTGLLCTASAQFLVIKGRVRCLNASPNSTKGAENIIIVPAFVPVKSTTTASAPPGYFEINTGVPFASLQDKQVTLYVISRCSQCKEIAKRVFISEDQDKINTDKTKVFVTVRDWQLNTRCTEAELQSFKADSMLAVISRQPSQKIADLSAATAAVGAPPLLNVLSTLTAGAALAGGVGSPNAVSIAQGKINYGSFLFSSAMTLTGNTGFNFSPSRNMSEAVFWNPSAIAHSNQSGNVSVFTNLKNNAKLSAFARLTDEISLGVGGIYTKQDEFRDVRFVDNNNDLTASHNEMLDEYAVFLSPVMKLGEKTSLGLTEKSIWQHFNNPRTLNLQQDNTKTSFTDNIVNKQSFDLDLSVSYKLSTAFQVGLNMMNLAGTQLYKDNFIYGEKNLAFRNQRSAGLGLSYKWQRFNFGSDILFTQDGGFYDATIGVNYVPFNDALISAGVAVKQLSYSVGFKMKYFRISYVDDNGLMVNQGRKPTVSFFNGKLYTSLVLDF